MDILSGRIVNSKFIPDSPKMLSEILERKNNKRVFVEIKSMGTKLRQYKFLYGVVYQTYKEELGYTTLDAVDNDLKELFFFEHVENKLTGAVEKRLKSKSKASKEELSKYISDCVLYGNTEMGFQIVGSEEFYGQQLQT